MTAIRLDDAILTRLKYSLGREPGYASLRDWRVALSLAIRDCVVDPWIESARRTREAGGKRVYYLSMEYLIGRMLEDSIKNLGLLEEAERALRPSGLSLDQVVSDEPDAALGNGGLGRLAACFMESMATIGCPAIGYGIRYEHGLFRQRFEEGRQIEEPEDWLTQQHVWEFEHSDVAFDIGFGGELSERDGRVVWQPGEHVVAQAYDTPVVGWQGRWANTLRLWGARPVRPLDLARFNRGEYTAAAEPEALARTISRVLYPDDTTEGGKELRLKQEYFFTAASLRDLLRRFQTEHGDLARLPQKVAIQLNDTHPAIAGPELVRLLHDENGMELDTAIETARACLNYTNHTLLPEALEQWSEDLLGRLLPRHVQLIERIDDRHAADQPSRQIRVRQDGQIRMGELSFVMAHRVNGVSGLHTDLMKSTVFKDLNRLHPERIVNQTNGVTPRRWMLSCNPRLSSLITEAIGTGWAQDLEHLSKLEPMAEDPAFVERFMAAKRANKQDLSDWLADNRGVRIDPEAMFDIQIKRIHEYKRQHLNILEAIALWQEIRDDPNGNWTPRVKMFGGKAAPGYVFAKEIIHLANSVARVLNADPLTNRYLQVLYPENYNVSLAERLIPAADLSEQISTAGKEASGTGNMKLALNGALTVGTLDGANVEIRDKVGEDNFFLFGMSTDEVLLRREMENHAARAVADDPRLARAVAAIRDGAFADGDPSRFSAIADDLIGKDYFLVCSDFSDYWRVQREIDGVFGDTARWGRMAALNTARSGWCSSDRTIRGYMREIWETEAIGPLDAPEGSAPYPSERNALPAIA